MILKKLIPKVEISLDFFLLSLPIVLTFSRALVEILLVLIITNWFLLLFLKKEKVQINTPLTWPLLSYWLAGLFSIFSSQFLMKSLEELLNLTEYVLLAFISMKQFQSSKRIQNLIPIIIFSSGIIAFDGLVQFFLKHDIILFRPAAIFQNTIRITASFSHPNNLAAYLAMATLFSVTRWYEKRQPIYIFHFLLVLCALILTYSRGGWVGLGISIMVLAIIRDKKLFILFFIFLILSLFTFPNILTERIKDIFNPQNITTQMRFETWKTTWDLFLQKPILGYGLKNFSSLLEKGYAHNCYLQILFETGALGLLSFLAILLTFFIQLFKNRFCMSILGFFCSILAFSIHSLGDTHLYSIPIATFFWLLLGAGFGMNMRKNEEKEQERGLPSERI